MTRTIATHGQVLCAAELVVMLAAVFAVSAAPAPTSVARSEMVVTDEDPRLEDRDAINRQIADGAVEAGRVEGRDLLVIADRQEAINAAMERAKPGDVVLLAGKGHEGSIIYGTEKTPWDDREAARVALRALGYG